MTDYLQIDAMEMDRHLGIHAAWLGEDGDAIAFTDDEDAALAAIHEMGRRDLGGACVVTGEVAQLWMRFHVPDGYQSDEWQGERCDPTDDGALRVVIARGVSDMASAELLGLA